MPVLNPEIFTDVLIECLKKKNDSRTLGKFMLSGQQQFRCAVNYFCKAKSVEIMDERIRVCVKIGRITRYHEISYQFSMINLIMKILGSSIDEFQILSCPENFNAIEYFLDKKIKNVIVYEDLSPKYRKLIASCDFIEKLQTVDVLVTYHGEIKYVIEMLKDKKLSFLQRLGKSHVTGKLVFKNLIRPRSKCIIPEFEHVRHDVLDIPNITFEPKNQKITRRVELNENLIAEFVLSLTPDFDYYNAR